MSATGRRLLQLAALLSLAIALLHVFIIFEGAWAYRYFAFPEEIGRLEEAGSRSPAALTWFLTSVFCLYALYALSGAGVTPRLPHLALGLALIGTIYLLRGLVIVPQLIINLRDPGRISPRYLVFSLISLAIGLVYICGTTWTWRELKGGDDATE